jgi:uncharacterized protein YbjT (DUF2867 family)
MRIVVLGATGDLGKALVSRAAEHDVIPVSRRGAYRADVTTGEGLAAAFSGAHIVIDATNARAGARDVLVDGARRVLEACASANVRHFVGVSIVGIDDSPAAYYQIKVAQEKMIEQSPVPWSLLRATQFHDLIPRMATPKLGVVVMPRGWKVQPVDVGEVAERLLSIALSPPAGRVPDMGGPEIHDFADLARRWARAAGKRRVVLALPLPGKLGRHLRSGALCTPEHKDGKITFDQWLAATYGAQPT